jgi:hypothetical protein
MKKAREVLPGLEAVCVWDGSANHRDATRSRAREACRASVQQQVIVAVRTNIALKM